MSATVLPCAPRRSSSSPLKLVLFVIALQSGNGVDDDAENRTRRMTTGRQDDDERREGANRDARGRRTKSPSCHREGKWHISTTAVQVCTNDDDFPPSWELPSVRGNFLFDDWSRCCEAMFPEAYDCGRNDVCIDADGDGSEVAGGNADPGGENDNECDNRKWHVSRSEAETCTNSDDFPSAWNDDYYLGKTMFSSKRDCCNSLESYGISNCRAKDECTGQLHDLPVAEADADASSCSRHPWHPTPTFEGCSNSPPGSYPHDWTAPGASDRFLYATHEACCAGVFAYEAGECPATNYCPTATPTRSPFACPSGHKWHRGTAPNECTNDLNYPSAWDDPAIAMGHLFDDPAECCAKHASTETCTVVDICGTMSTTIEPGELWEAPLMPTTATPTDSPTFSMRPTTGKVSTTVSPTESPMISIRPKMGCEQKNKRKCIKDPECSWGKSANACSDVPTAGDGDVVECGKEYHPTSILERKCSNDDIFPSIWGKPGNVEKYFFASGEDCCSSFYSDGPCAVVNVCPSGS